MRLVWLGVVVALSMGCYTVQLPAIPEVAGRATTRTATTDIPIGSATYVYDVRSFVSGIGNRWRIDVGDALVKYANAYLRPIFPEGDDLRIQITVEGFDVRHFQAHIDSRFTVFRGTDVVFNKKYHAQGIGYYARTFWGGAFAMKSSMRKTTDEALRSLFEQFLADMQQDGGLLQGESEARVD